MSQIAKVMEGFTLDSLLNEVGNKLDTKQFALPRKSTTQALVYLLHLTLAGLDVGHCSARLFFADFRKRFDLVGHNTIIAELENLKVYPAIIRWVKVFLTGRAQCVKFGMATSSWKRDALRQAKNSCSSKRFLAFSERFWEKEGIFGGKTKTDLPSHMLYYLKGGLNFTGSIVMSYIWGDKSCVFAARGDNELLQIVLSNLATIHGKHIQRLFTGGVVKHWSLDPYILGAYAYHTPFQRSKIHKELESAADRIWFAGEYISVPHAWIESAVKSALRTAVYMSTDMHSEFFT